MSVSIKRAGIVLVAMIGCLCSAARAQAQLKNRSFESGSDPGDAAVLAPGSKTIEDWTVVDGEVSYVGRKWQHAEGARSVALSCGGGITQTIETEPDQTYEVRFNMAGDPDAMPSLK